MTSQPQNWLKHEKANVLNAKNENVNNSIVYNNENYYKAFENTARRTGNGAILVPDQSTKAVLDQRCQK